MGAGCGYVPLSGGRDFPSTPFSGQVLLGGKLVTEGWVGLYPIDGTVGVPVSSRIGSDGRFFFAAAPVGRVAVRITLPRSVREGVGSVGLRRILDVSAGPMSPWRVDTSPSGMLSEKGWLVELADPLVWGGRQR